MGQELNGKIALVTGATSGIGRATALRFAAEGAQVVIVGRKTEELARTTREIAQNGGAALALAVDLRDQKAAAEIVPRTLERFGGLDILVNAAGIISMGTIADTTETAWQEMLDINLNAVFRLMQQATPALIERRGNVVNVSSVTGLRSFPGVLAYCVSKAAVDQLTRCASLELAAQGVRVNAVNPGVVVTELHRTSGMADEKYAAFLEHSQTTHPLGRVGTPEEVAELILFLASERAAWVTGATYVIDGGRGNTCAR
jgi:NAD(P)-dependent dehydrogenase (short-subunit alcohol dehydrogenase family)